MEHERRTATISGKVRHFGNGSEVALIGRVVNYNAEVLEELIRRVETLEKSG